MHGSSGPRPEPGDPRRMWHVTLTVGGAATRRPSVRAALVRLANERPFLMTGRYDRDRAEVRYWEEAERLEDAAALALRLWGEHRVSAGLPPWEVVGLEIVDQDTFHRRGAQGGLRVVASGAVTPL